MAMLRVMVASVVPTGLRGSAIEARANSRPTTWVPIHSDCVIGSIGSDREVVPRRFRSLLVKHLHHTSTADTIIYLLMVT